MVVSVVGQATGMAAVSKDGAERTTLGLFEKPKPSLGMPNMLRRLRRLHREGFPVRLDIAPDALLLRLQAFHRDLSSLCACKLMRDDQIRTFVEDH